jgi:hypothetical protein
MHSGKNGAKNLLLDAFFAFFQQKKTGRSTFFRTLPAFWQ